MNTPAPIGRPSSRPIPALLMASIALVLCCASVEAGCGSHQGRPAVALDWRNASTLAESNQTTPPEKPPTCSGLNCGGMPVPPIVTSPEPDPYRDLSAGVSAELLLDQPAESVVSRSAGLNPIGRETEIERPPCRPAMAAVRL
jgi:hypothetical protein